MPWYVSPDWVGVWAWLALVFVGLPAGLWYVWPKRCKRHADGRYLRIDCPYCHLGAPDDR